MVFLEVWNVRDFGMQVSKKLDFTCKTVSFWSFLATSVKAKKGETEFRNGELLDLWGNCWIGLLSLPHLVASISVSGFMSSTYDYLAVLIISGKQEMGRYFCCFWGKILHFAGNGSPACPAAALAGDATSFFMLYMRQDSLSNPDPFRYPRFTFPTRISSLRFRLCRARSPSGP